MERSVASGAWRPKARQALYAAALLLVAAGASPARVPGDARNRAIMHLSASSLAVSLRSLLAGVEQHAVMSHQVPALRGRSASSRKLQEDVWRLEATRWETVSTAATLALTSTNTRSGGGHAGEGGGGADAERAAAEGGSRAA